MGLWPPPQQCGQGVQGTHGGGRGRGAGEHGPPLAPRETAVLRPSRAEAVRPPVRGGGGGGGEVERNESDCSIEHLCIQIRVVIGGLLYTWCLGITQCIPYEYLHDFKLVTSLLALQHFGAPSLYT